MTNVRINRCHERRCPQLRKVARVVSYAISAVFALFSPYCSKAIAERPVALLPVMTASGWLDGPEASKALTDSDLSDYQQDFRNEFARKDAPDEVLALATMSASDLILTPWVEPNELIEVLVYGERGELRFFSHCTRTRYFWRELSADEVRSIRAFVRANRVDSLKSLGQMRGDGGKTVVNIHGTAHVLVRMNAVSGIRTTVFNPPSHNELLRRRPGDPLSVYTKLIDFFQALADSKSLVVRYRMSRPVPGLKVVYANPARDICGVWMNNGELFVKVRGVHDSLVENRVLLNGVFGAPGTSARQLEEQVTQLGDLRINTGCASLDGRWAVGVADNDGRLVCLDRRSNAFVQIDEAVRAKYVPLHYIAAQRAFLLARFSIRPLNGGRQIFPTEFRLLDPKNGETRGLPGQSADLSDSREYVQWLQPLPRQLEAAEGQKYCAWISMTEDDRTLVGRYDLEKFRWLSSQAIASLHFHTIDMWVDELAHQIYIVYKGQLLSVPLSQRHWE
jgi:hypothetical protein